jgi:hypothetical protein
MERTMSDTKHTPGPWRVYPRGSCVPHYDVCERIVSDHPSGRSLNDGPSDADAALIAAAPDLLDACRAALARIESDIDGKIPSKETVKLRAAIARAQSAPAGKDGGK